MDLVNETKLDSEIISWLAFAAEKVFEVDALTKAMSGKKVEVYASADNLSFDFTLRVDGCNYIFFPHSYKLFIMQIYGSALSIN